MRIKLEKNYSWVLHCGSQEIPQPEREIRKSGRFLLRIKPTIHQKLAQAALIRGMSLNKYIEEKVSA